MDNIQEFVNQVRFARTVAEDKQVNWGPTVYKKEFSNLSLTTAIYDAMQWIVKEGATIVHDVNVILTPGYRNVIQVWYGCEEIVEDPRDGQPISVENL